MSNINNTTTLADKALANTLAAVRARALALTEKAKKITNDVLALGADATNTDKHREYNARKDAQIVRCIAELLGRLPADTVYESLTTDTRACLASLSAPLGKAPAKVQVQEGDNIVELLEKYADVKDVYSKIMKSINEQGLHINGATIVR